jgi:hypothetical protein
MARETERYDWNDGDFTISDDINLPSSLKSVVSNAPQGDQAIGIYLSDLVKVGKITTDDVTFLIDSGVLQN